MKRKKKTRPTPSQQVEAQENQVLSPIENGNSWKALNPQQATNMPESWLNQFSDRVRDILKQEKKTIVLGTIAGSSVLAAILGIAADYFLVPYRARYQARLAYETKLSDLILQNQDTELAERRKAYVVLDKELEKIAKLLNTYISTCEQVSKDPASKGYVDFAKSSWDSLTNQLGEVTNAKNACHSLNSADNQTADDVDEFLGRLALNLFATEVQKNKEKNPELIRLMPEINSAIKKIREEITKKKQQLNLQSEKQGNPK